MKNYIDMAEVNRLVSDAKASETRTKLRKEAFASMAKFKSLAEKYVSTIEAYEEAKASADAAERKARGTSAHKAVRELVTRGLNCAARDLAALSAIWAQAQKLLEKIKSAGLTPAQNSPAETLAALISEGKKLHYVVQRPKGQPNADMKSAFERAKK
jgi:phosphoribosylcarboxyaminoimidazole (NCAIR) mutase